MKTKRKIEAMEDYFGLAFVPKKNKHDEDEYIKKDWGKMKNIDERLKEIEEKLKIKKSRPWD